MAEVADVKLFGKWDYEGVELDDLALQVSIVAAATILGDRRGQLCRPPAPDSSASSPSEDVGGSLQRAVLSRRPVVGLSAAAVGAAGNAMGEVQGGWIRKQHDSSSHHGLWLPASDAAASQLAHRGRRGGESGECSPKRRRGAHSRREAMHGALRCFP